MIQRKKPQNLLQFSAQDLAGIKLHLNTKAKSLTLGRLIHTFEKDQQQYWLKTQAIDMNENDQHGFVNEIGFYQQFVDQTEPIDFLLPFQIVTDVNKIIAQESSNTALIISHGQTLLGDISSSSIDRIKATFFKMLDAVEQMHSFGWIHGDLKGEHFLEFEQCVCLIDFEQVEKISSTQLIPYLTATPRYMAPELFQGQAKTVHSDIYALGIIFYEWLTGQRLVAKNYEEWAYLHCQHLIIELPQHFYMFEKLIQRMLAKQKNSREHNIFKLKHCLLTENA